MKLNEIYDEYLLKKLTREATKDFNVFTRRVLEKIGKEKSLTRRKVRKIVEKEKISLKRFPALVDTAIATSAIVNYANLSPDERKSKAAKPVREKLNNLKRKVPQLDIKNPKQFVDTSYGIRSSFKKDGVPNLGLNTQVDSGTYEPGILKSFDSFLDSVTPGRIRIMQQALKHTNSQLKNYKKDLNKNVMGYYLKHISDGYSKKNSIAKLQADMGARVNTQTVRFMETEMHGVYEESKIRNAKSNGYKYKYWRSQRDVRVRDSHRRLDGKIVKHDEMFKVGDSEGLYPGDPNLPLKERINCRCSTEFGFVPRGTRRGIEMPKKKIPREIEAVPGAIPLSNTNNWVPQKDGEEEELWVHKYGYSQKEPIRKWTKLFNKKNKDKTVSKLYEKIPNILRIGKTREREESENINIDNRGFETFIDEADGIYQSSVGRSKSSPQFFLNISKDGFNYAPETNTRVINHEMAHLLEGQILQLTGLTDTTTLGFARGYETNEYMGSGLYSLISDGDPLFMPAGFDKINWLLSTGDKMPDYDLEPIDSLNPTGGLFVDYTPEKRARAPLALNMTTLDKTSGRDPDEMITIYRGTVPEQKEIVPGDFITTSFDLAQSYSGDGYVLSKEVPLKHILDDWDEDRSDFKHTHPQDVVDEYLYRPDTFSLESNTLISIYDESKKLYNERKKHWNKIVDETYERIDTIENARSYKGEREVSSNYKEFIINTALEDDIKTKIGKDTFNLIEVANKEFDKLQRRKQKLFKDFTFKLAKQQVDSDEGLLKYKRDVKKIERRWLEENDNEFIDGYHWEDLRAAGSFLDAMYEGEVERRLPIRGHGPRYHSRMGNPEAELMANYTSIKSTAPELAKKLKKGYSKEVEALEKMHNIYLTYAENHVENVKQKKWDGMNLKEFSTNKKVNNFKDVRDFPKIV